MPINSKSCPQNPGINLISTVAASWGLHKNKDKCVFLRFQRGHVAWEDIGASANYYLNNHPIAKVPHHRGLGVLVDPTLRFHLHIRSIANKASGVSANLLKSTLCRDSKFMLTLYTTYIRPLLEYASTVWNTEFTGDLRLLESVQELD